MGKKKKFTPMSTFFMFEHKTLPGIFYPFFHLWKLLIGTCPGPYHLLCPLWHELPPEKILKKSL